MYTIYTDKTEDFKCKITVEGSEISKTSARLVLEGKNYTLLFEGEIDKNGNCTVPIKKVKNVLAESEVGTMRLEVISDDTFFSPWEDEFEVKASKKVTVEFEDKSSKPVIKENKVNVSVSVPSKQEKTPVKKTEKIDVPHGKTISEMLSKNGIRLSNMKENANKVSSLIKEYVSKHNVKTSQEELLEEIINNLKY
jgi:TusA-related sulfurtransferase